MKQKYQTASFEMLPKATQSMIFEAITLGEDDSYAVMMANLVNSLCTVYTTCRLKHKLF